MFCVLRVLWVWVSIRPEVLRAKTLKLCTHVGSIFAVSRQVLNITFHVEFAIFSAGCIFPLTFNVSSAFKRRDAALESLSELKANIIAIYLNMGMFDLSGTARAQAEALPIIRHLICNIESCLRGPRNEYGGLVWGQNDIDSAGAASSRRQGSTGKHRMASHLVYDDFALLGMCVSLYILAYLVGLRFPLNVLTLFTYSSLLGFALYTPLYFLLL